MWLINIIVIKLKIILVLNIINFKKSTFNTLKCVYGYLFILWQGAKIVYFTLPAPIPNSYLFCVCCYSIVWKNHHVIKLIVENLILWQMCTIPPPNVVFMSSINMWRTPNSLKDSNVSPSERQRKKEESGCAP